MIRPRNHQRGFTLVEMMVAVLIIAVIGAVTVPVASRMKTRGNITRSLRDIAANLKRARMIAGSGKTIPGNASNPNNASTDPLRTRFAAIEVASSSSFIVVADSNSVADETELHIAAYDLAAKDAALRIVSPSEGTRIVFGPSGSPLSGTGFDDEIVIEDQSSGRRGSVKVSASGAVRITYNQFR